MSKRGKITVLFDHQIFSEQRYGGISRYFANLIREVEKRKNFAVKVAVRYSKNYYLDYKFQSLPRFLGKLILKRDAKRYRWNKKFSINHLKKGDYDIFHATYYDNYSIAINNKPLVVTIHDMIHENSPEMFLDSQIIISQKKMMMEAASCIIAISNFTRNEIIRFYPQFESKISVVYHGIKENIAKVGTISHVKSKKYILFVGERGNYKNFKPFTHAIAPLLKQLSINIICAGGKKFSSEEQQDLIDLGISEVCEQLDADEQTLKTLYQHALVFVYPSSQEGFGLPILEAFQNDCAIACSSRSCLPEIGGSAVAYFDPADSASILAAIERIIEDPAYAKELKTKGRERLKLFSMENCIEKTINVYERALLI